MSAPFIWYDEILVSRTFSVSRAFLVSRTFLV